MRMSADVLFLANEQAVIRPSIDKLTETARMKRSYTFSTLITQGLLGGLQ